MSSLHEVTEQDRIDYARLSRKFEVAQGIVWTRVLVEKIEAYRLEKPNVKGNYKTKTVKRYDDGEYLYTVEVWGELAEFILGLDPARYAKYVSRLDFRIECQLTGAGLDTIYDVAKQKNSHGRNITRYDTRPRDKKEGRHAGGTGVAIGSHGSTKRLSFYKRKNEVGAIEFQSTLAECQKIINRAWKTQERDIMKTDRDFWAYVKMHGVDALIQMAEQSVNASFDDVLNIANTDGVDHDKHERIKYEVVTALGQLDRDTKREIMMAIQLELF